MVVPDSVYDSNCLLKSAVILKGLSYCKDDTTHENNDDFETGKCHGEDREICSCSKCGYGD